MGEGAATIAPRISAAAIDFMVLTVAGLVLTLVLGMPTPERSLLVVGIVLAIGAAYFIGSWLSTAAATPGMRLFHLTLRGTDAGPVDRRAAARRWLVLVAPFALLSFHGWGIGFYVSLILAAYYGYLLYTVAQSPDRRGLHDVFAGTVVARI